MFASLSIIVLTLALADGQLALHDYTDIYNDDHALRVLLHNERGFRSLGMSSAFSRGCLHEGRWYGAGAHVKTRDASCLQCACGRGALSCRHRACATPPRPPPKGCHLLHRKDACCPELHCADGVTVLELEASSRLDDDRPLDTINVAALSHACVESGTVYASGSAMSSSMACEQCFCLRGARRCVKPQCLPPPEGCHPKPSAGACCPQRYYCEHRSTATEASEFDRQRDCKVSGTWYGEGERVHASESNCSHCFCLRGTVHCHLLMCAPPLHGCSPIVRPGECCPHQYICHHEPKVSGSHEVYRDVIPSHNHITHEALKSARHDDTDLLRSNLTSDMYEKTKNDKSSTTTDSIETVATNKVKRKTNDTHNNTNTKEKNHHDSKVSSSLQKQKPRVNLTETEIKTERITTDQPESSVRIVINGTINCTTELMSTNASQDFNQTDIMERTPSIDRMDIDIEDHTYNPNDIITDKSVNGEYDENDTFTINVTSSLVTNKSTPGPIMYENKKGIVSDLTEIVNTSKIVKEDYDYDYNEPTLPPSLPNLKIIPFVAADAVVDEDRASQEPVLPNFPILEREDKYPVYYPNNNQEIFANRREDSYNPTLPLFTSEKSEPYPSLTHDIDITSSEYHNVDDLATPVHEYTVSTSFGNPMSDIKSVTKEPSGTSTGVQTPAVNLFSPPVETEGGFIPKGPGIIDEYYAVFPSTPSGPTIPHLTTSMQLDIEKGTCLSADGRQVLEGDTISLSCSICTCAWGELHCSPRPCLTPPGCIRRPATISTADLCCGELVCGTSNKTRSKPSTTTTTENPSKDVNKYYQNSTTDDSNLRLHSSTESQELTKVSKLPELPSHSDNTPNENVKLNITQVTQQNLTKVNEIITTTDSIMDSMKNKGNIVKHLLESEIKHDLSKNISTTVQTPTENPLFTTTVNIMKEIIHDRQDEIVPSQNITIEEENITEEPDQSQEYEDEEEDEGFSFGSVLKLLLSDSYDATTVKPKPPPNRMSIATEKYESPVRTTTVKYETPTRVTTPKYDTSVKETTLKFKPFKSTEEPTTARAMPTTTTTKATTKRIYINPSIVPFVPLKNNHQVYAPPKNTFPTKTVNKIDHLVLGEATAIKKTTNKPISYKPINYKPINRPSTTKKPYTVNTTTKTLVQSEVIGQGYTSVAHEGSRPPGSSLLGGGLLKLAGCNIYGRMYRVGRIIDELSSPCQECRCTEQGVQCRALKC